MILLSLHILFATSLVITSTGVVFSALQQRVTRLYQAMIGAFGLTLISGASLLFVGGGIGRICATMSAVTLVVFVARYYYRVRVISQAV